MKYKSILIFLMAGTIFICGCSKNDDDNNNSRKNGFTYKGTFYATELFGIEFWSNVLYAGDKLRLVFTSGTWDEQNQRIVENNYTELHVDVISFLEGTLDTGFYAYSSPLSDPGDLDSDGESLCINFNRNQGACDDSSWPLSGTLTVEKNGNTYTIEFSFRMENTELLEGYYKGELDYNTTVS